MVRRKGRTTQLWSVDKLETKLVDMRELYQDWTSAVSAEEVRFSRVYAFYAQLRIPVFFFAERETFIRE